MTVRTMYATGEPCWADLQTPDVAAAKDFYHRIFGWTYQDFPTPDGRSYAQAFLRGHLVATIAPQNPLQLQAGTSAKWNVYFAAKDAGDVLEEARHAGGAAQFGPEQVGDTGVLGFLAPPGGGTTGIWQAGSHYGSHLLNEPGALAWAELFSPEPRAAVGFFQQLFGHEVTEYPQDDGGSYSTLLIDGKEVAGVVPADEGEEADWQIYFGVADVAAAAAAAQAAGGEVLVEPDEEPADGSLATIRDPQGGILNLIQVT
ncbi:putative enzyme related to lactoylglutathione lyase [Pseudarthrobacter defluvii]|uniref:VOC family protein n=1 Tax=Pseudarthrobacter defluvii TaxID=410837 RepID=UPI00278A2EC6|nr:VOC family protein [Pseudarthrobacter defluvii]MDQ0767486.1 putative enzyme related to lactoylglutathione lyase [Pseudarthrobacter defluvii]